MSAAPTQYVAESNRYARDVVKGRIEACKWVKAACQRQLDDLERWPDKDKSAPYRFDKKAAERVCGIIEMFPHVKGVWARARQKLLLQPWQAFIISTVFGWKRREDDSRRFRTVYIEIPRKNAKSTITSAVGNYLVACDGEPGAHVVSAATARDQAKIVFADAQLMAKHEPGFLRKFGVTVNAHSIAVLKTASKFNAVSAQDSNLDGLNLSGALIDELHAHKTRGIWDVLETATGSRSQPLIWAITHAGVNRASICWEQRGYITKVLEHTLQDESYFGVIYTLDEEDDPFEESSWRKANPNYGVSIYPEKLQEAALKAQSMPSARNTFLTKHLNVWVNSDESWLPAAAWASCADSTLEPEDFYGRECFMGVDLAIRSDIAAVVTLFPPKNEADHWTVFGRYYLPEDVVERPENTHYQGWEHLGLLTSTSGHFTDHDVILDDLVRFGENYQVIEIASDPWRNKPLVRALENRGVTVPIVDVRQTRAIMSPSMTELEALVASRKIRHNGDPVLSWMLSNVIPDRQGDGLYPKKERDDNKIDGVTAMLVALERALRHRESTPDYAARGGLLTI